MTFYDKEKFPRGVEVAGGVIVENNTGKILLVKSPKWHNKWTLPGGHIEPGEKIEEALLREAEEEVGLNLKSLGIIDFSELIDSKDFHRPAHFICFTILCKTDTTDITLDNVELTEFVWVDPREASKLDLGEILKMTIKSYLKFKGLE